jgi:hypothetical protein
MAYTLDTVDKLCNHFLSARIGLVADSWHVTYLGIPAVRAMAAETDDVRLKEALTELEGYEPQAEQAIALLRRVWSLLEDARDLDAQG